MLLLVKTVKGEVASLHAAHGGMAGGVDKVWVISSALCSPFPISSTRCQPSLIGVAYF